MIQIKTVFENLVNELKDKFIYKVIFKFQGTVMNAEGSMSSNIKSTVPIFIIKGVQVESLLTKMTMAYFKYVDKYSVPDNINVGIMMKEWIISNEFEGFNNMVTSLVKNEQILLNKFGVESAQDKDLVKFNIKKEDIYKNLKKFKVWKGVPGNNYGEQMYPIDISVYDKYGLDKKKIYFTENQNYDPAASLAAKNIDLPDKFYIKIYFNKDYLIKVTQITSPENEDNKTLFKNGARYQIRVLECTFESGVYSIINTENSIENWVDEVYSNKDNLIIRKLSEKDIVTYKNNKLDLVERLYKDKNLPESYKDIELNVNIGALDIETEFRDNGTDCFPSSVCFKTDNVIKVFNVADYKGDSALMMKDFLHNIITRKNHNKMFYCHNLSGFDSIFILKTYLKYKHLFLNQVKIKISTNSANDIISLVITKKVKFNKVIRIIIGDSLKLLSFSSDKAGDIFNSVTVKGLFPYNYLTKDTGEFKGAVPDIK